MPQTIKKTGKDISYELSMLKPFCDAQALAECVDADHYEREESLFSDPGPDYTKHRFYKGGTLIHEFYVPGY